MKRTTTKRLCCLLAARGVPDYCMSSTLVTMMLDGLAQKHKLKLRDKRPAP